MGVRSHRPRARPAEPRELDAGHELFHLYQAFRHRRILGTKLGDPEDQLYMNTVNAVLAADCTAGRADNPKLSSLLRQNMLSWRQNHISIQIEHYNYLIDFYSGSLTSMGLSKNTFDPIMTKMRKIAKDRYGRSNRDEDFESVEQWSRKFLWESVQGPKSPRPGASAARSKEIPPVNTTSNRFSVLTDLSEVPPSEPLPKPQRTPKNLAQTPKGKRGAQKGATMADERAGVSSSKTPMRQKRGRHPSSDHSGSPELPSSKRLDQQESPVAPSPAPVTHVGAPVTPATPSRVRRRSVTSPDGGTGSHGSPSPKRSYSDTLALHRAGSQSSPNHSSNLSSPPQAANDITSEATLQFPKADNNKHRGNSIHKVWEIPKITSDTIVLGTFENATKFTRKNSQVASYPGLRTTQLQKLFEGFKHGETSTNPGRKPSNIILSVGLYEKGCKIDTAMVQMRCLMNTVTALFPDTKFFISEINIPQGSSADERSFFSDLNRCIRDHSVVRDFSLITQVPGDTLPGGRGNDTVILEHLLQSLN